MAQALTPGGRETLAVFERTAEPHEPVTTTEVSEHLDISRRSTYDRLDTLAKDGFINSKKVGGGGRIWWRPQAAPEERERGRRNLRLHDASADVYVTLDAEGKFEYVSVGSIYGYDTDRIDGHDAFQFIHPDDRDQAQGEFEELVESDEIDEKHMDIRFRHMDGTWVHLAIDAKDLLDDPLIQGVGIFARDISDRRDRERELERYETIIEQVGVGVYVLDEDFTFTHVNDAYVEMTGYDRDELIGSHATLVVSPEISRESLERTLEMDKNGEQNDTLQADIHRADGTTLRAESRFGAIEDEDGSIRKVGVVRDISDRVANDRELKRRIEQEEVIADLGRKALERRDLDAILEEAVTELTTILKTDYSKVLELHPQENELVLRKGVGWNDEISPVPAVETESQAAHTLFADSPVIVEDLESETRFEQEAMLTEHGVSSGITALVGSKDDPWGVLGTFARDHRSFSEYDANFVQAIANILASAIDRHIREQELERQQEELAALNNLNAVVREITAGVIEKSTRSEIEQTVCDHLASSDSYAFAWTGELKPSQNEIVPRAEAGTGGYLEEIRLSTDASHTTGQGPGGRAARTGEPQVVSDAFEDSSFEPWRDHARERGFRSAAAIPIKTENSLYGILGVYSERANAFAAEELTMISQLGRTIGHAISAVERKQALMSDQVTELQLSIPNVSAVIGIESHPGTVHFEEVVDVGSDRYVVYGRLSDFDSELFREAADAVPGWESIRFVGDGTRFELLLTDPPIFSMIAERGGEVVEARFEDDEYQFTIHLPPSGDTRSIIDDIQESYPVELLVRRQISRGDADVTDHLDILEKMTDRQRAALESAYHAGFFEWPRATTGQDLAETLDIAPPTFHQHLRRAEQELVGSVLD